MVDKTDRTITKKIKKIGYELTYSRVNRLFIREYTKDVSDGDLVTLGRLLITYL